MGSPTFWGGVRRRGSAQPLCPSCPPPLLSSLDCGRPAGRDGASPRGSSAPAMRGLCAPPSAPSVSVCPCRDRAVTAGGSDGVRRGWGRDERSGAGAPLPLPDGRSPESQLYPGCIQSSTASRAREGSAPLLCTETSPGALLLVGNGGMSCHSSNRLVVCKLRGLRGQNHVRNWKTVPSIEVVAYARLMEVQVLYVHEVLQVV